MYSRELAMDLTNYSTLPHETAFTGKSNLKRYYKDSATQSAIDYALQGHNAYTQMRQAKKPKAYNPSYTHEHGDHVEVDLLELTTLKTRNRGIAYYLIVIDAFSRYVFSRSLKKKTAQACRSAFESILDEIPFSVQRIVCDDGGEFRGTFKALLDSKNIRKTLARTHAPYVERVIQTLKSILSKTMKHNETLQHFNVFESVVEAYNNRRHRIIKMTPAEALDPENAERVRYEHALEWRKREESFQKRRVRFRVGDLVRPQKSRHTWARSFHQVFETEIHRVSAVILHLPIAMYEIETLDGKPVRQRKYASELQKVRIPQDLTIEKVHWSKKRKNSLNNKEQVLVKYAELPESHSEYIDRDLIPDKRRMRKPGIWS